MVNSNKTLVIVSHHSVDPIYEWVTIWLFNIAMENPVNKWRFIAGKIIYKWVIYTMAMLVISRWYAKLQRQFDPLPMIL